MPKYQGELDGLCGPYAIANALEHCGLELFQEAFRLSCRALAARRWPETLWDGTTLGDLKRMIADCRRELHGMKTVRVSYPFHRRIPANNAEYWQRFDEIFDDQESPKCAIIGLTRPSYHWIVAYRDGRRVSFSDSTAGAPFVRKNRKNLFAGSRNGNPSVWLIDRSEFILFEVDGIK